MDPSAQALLAYKSFAVLGWFAVVLTAERLWPAARRADFERGPGRGPLALWLGERRRLGRNGALWLANAPLDWLLVVPLSAWAARFDLGMRPEWWGGRLGLGLDLLLLDVWIYWWHRANHEVPFLWRFHRIHHLDRFLDGTSAVRFHFGEVFLSAFARAAVIIALDVPLASVLVFESMVLMGAMFHHSNLRLAPRLERALARAVVTPSIHWVHHHAARGDTDSNYATILSLWDPLFGTRSRTRRQLDMEIGVEGEDEAPLIELVLRPFRTRRA
ncbi:MAG: sterol desaturase family protein [Alphaproteobacteria bacterium]